MAAVTELQAGPEMDAEVARRVFGVNAWTESDFHGPHQDAHTDQSEMFPTGWLPRFSDSITAAWLVVEKMLSDRTDQETYLRFVQVWYYDGAAAPGPVAAERICRAALAALEAPVGLPQP
jgi:hypothetical protein